MLSISEPISGDELAAAGSVVDDAGDREATSVWKAAGEDDNVDADFALSVAEIGVK